MANCPKCGAPLPVDSQFCVNCGNRLAPGGASNGFTGFFTALNNTTDYTPQCDPRDAAENKVMGILAYIPLLFLIPLFAKKDSVYARFHTNQGILANLALLALLVVNTVFGLIIGMIFGIGGVSALIIIGSVLCWIVGIASTAVFLYFMIIGIINVANNKYKELPIIGSLRVLK